jgi:hypothetical protein
MKSLSIVFIVLLITVATVATTTNKTSMVWMCLERCEETKQEILDTIVTLNKYSTRTLTAISFELYNIGGGSSLIKNTDLSNVGPVVQKIRGVNGDPLETFPMISSYPYPKELIDWMRYLFQNPEPFINQAIQEAKRNRWTGYNLDLEPVTGVNSTDAENYALFIQKFANALHQNQMKLNVDTAAWSILWNYQLISRSLNADLGDIMITMGTYTSNNDSWSNQLNKVIAESDDLRKIGIGLMPEKNDGSPLSKEDIDYRFAKIKQYNVTNVEVWKLDQKFMSDSSYWWKALEDYMRN